MAGSAPFTGASSRGNLTLRSGPQGPRLEGWPTMRVPRYRCFSDVACRPSFETAVTRPPQDEDFVGPSANVGTHEWRVPGREGAPWAVAAEASQAGRRPARRGECRAIAKGNLRAGRMDRIVSASTDSSRWTVDPVAPSRARATTAIPTGATARLCLRPQEPRRMLSCGRSNPLISLDATASDRTDRKKRPSFYFGAARAPFSTRVGQPCPARRCREGSPLRLAAAAAVPGRSPTMRIVR